MHLSGRSNIFNALFLLLLTGLVAALPLASVAGDGFGDFMRFHLG